MQPRMAISVLISALRLARRSWRGQAGVLIIGTLAFGATTSFGDAGVGLGIQAVVTIVTLILLLAGAVHAAHAQDPGTSSTTAAAMVQRIFGLAPRLLAQVTLSIAPALVVGLLTLQVAGAIPLVGLLLMPVAFAVAVASAPMAALSIVAVVSGDQRWLPTRGWQGLRAHPWSLLLSTLVGAVASAMAAVPVVLLGFVFTAVAGPFGLLGQGLASGAIVPLAGCWAVALWSHVGFDGTAMAAADEPVAFDERRPAGQASTSGWIDGPAWDVVVEPGAVWGTWVRLDAAAHVAFRLSWSGTVPPQLALGSEDGTWVAPGVAVRSGDVIPAQLPAGNTYVQVAAGDTVAQAISITMLVHGAHAAA